MNQNASATYPAAYTHTNITVEQQCCYKTAAMKFKCRNYIKDRFVVDLNEAWEVIEEAFI